MYVRMHRNAGLPRPQVDGEDVEGVSVEEATAVDDDDDDDAPEDDDGAAVGATASAESVTDMEDFLDEDEIAAWKARQDEDA